MNLNRKFATFYGELSEWLKEHAWKVCIPERVSRVRIPDSPLVMNYLNTSL